MTAKLLTPWVLLLTKSIRVLSAPFLLSSLAMPSSDTQIPTVHAAFLSTCDMRLFSRVKTFNYGECVVCVGIGRVETKNKMLNVDPLIQY